ncbi:jg9610 [Pararge aegeria aegeria]|uniref:Jg9610 protein n=1 Tax=Pararge aegeria aegeria TaxID=348720 RepID=A0A8S4RZ46_9NEOP|nr:jg9610 [Pararge aegeria aegeria]
MFNQYTPFDIPREALSQSVLCSVPVSLIEITSGCLFKANSKHVLSKTTMSGQHLQKSKSDIDCFLPARIHSWAESHQPRVGLRSCPLRDACAN